MLLLLSALVALVSAQQQGLASCLQAAGLNYSDVSSSNFGPASLPFNLQSSLRYKPSAVVFAASSIDLSKAIQCAVANNVTCSTRGGGHSYVNDGNGGKDGALVLDVSSINGIDLDDSTGIVKIGSGQHLGPIYLALNDRGRALSAGTCPNVGIGGHAACGGVGYSSRAHGLAIDQLVAAEVVFANSTIATITPASYPDLWYAVNGAAASFVSVAYYWFQTWPAPPKNTGYYITFISTPDVAAQALLSVQQWVQTEDSRDFGMNFEIWSSINNAPGLVGWNINGVLHDARDSSNFDARLGSLLRMLPTPSTTTYSPDVSWIQAINGSTGGLSLDLTGPNVQTNATFFVKSVVLKEFTPDSAHAMMQYIASNLQTRGSNTEFFVQMHVIGGAGSKIAEVSSDVSCFARRGDLWNGQVYIYSTGGDVPQSGIDFVSGIHSAVVNNLNGADWGAYLCYSYDQVDNVGLRYYGAGYDRLVSIKKQLDPNGLFDYHLGVQSF